MAYPRRSSGRRPGYSRPYVRRARARNPKRFPASKFGKVYLPRGSDFTLKQFGATVAEATGDQLKERLMSGWRGRGKYSAGKNFRKWATGAVKSVGRGVGSAANSMLLGQMASAGSAGQGLYSGQGMYAGQGLYDGQGSYSENQLIDGGREAPSSVSENDETDTITFSDCEFVKDVFAPAITAGSSSQFASQTISLNPGLPGTMPNLSQMAVNYVEYEIVQCVFELRPVISENNVNNGQSGIAMMVFNYNSNDDPYDNKEDVMQSHGSVSGRIVERIVCGVECDPTKVNSTKYFVRSGPIPIGKDADEYDHGILTIATNNIPSDFSNVQIHELWCSYTVRLKKRKAGALRLLNQQKDQFVLLGDYNAADWTGAQTMITGARGWGKNQQNNIGCDFFMGVRSGTFPNYVYNGTALLSIIFPADLNGLFDIQFFGEGTSALGAPACSAFSNTNLGGTGNITFMNDLMVAGLTSLDVPDSYATNVPNGGTTNIVTFRQRVRVRSATGGVDNKICFSLGTLTGGAFGACSVEVTEYSPALWTSRKNQKPILLNVLDDKVIY